MRPLDPRLLRHAGRARPAIGGLAGLGAVTAGATIAQAWLLATVISQVSVDKATLPYLALALLGALVAVRAATAWAGQVLAHRASAAAKTQLRGALLARVIALGPSWRRGAAGDGEPARDAAALTQLATTGLDGLDGYFTSYLPALILAAAVPLTVLAVIAVADPLSGAAVALTLPLVPLFGAFIGMATSAHARRRWRALATLAHHFHDVVGGLPTLRVFGRADAQRSQIARVTAEYRRATMATLRLAFASSLALELIATMSVALVATEIGLRLAYGHLDLRTGLFVLILAPEAYLPLRTLGAQFHATADGLAAAEQVFAVLETPGGAAEGRPVEAAAVTETAASCGVPGGGHRRGAGVIRVAGVSVRHEGRADPAPSGATFTVVPGRLTVLVGPSGCGKTTLLSVLLGFTEPTAGSVGSDGVDGVDRVDGGTAGDGRRAGWLPQEPTLFAGTVAENIRLGRPGAPAAAVAAAARDAALDDVDLGRVLGERGTGLSAGQCRRVALARALLPGARLLLLDEPTAGLDAEREAAVTETLRRYAEAGHAVVVVSHRPAVIAAADEVVDLSAPAREQARPEAREPAEARA